MEKKFPGPNAIQYLEKLKKYYATTTITSRVVPERREGSRIIDVDGFQFLDLHGGASVMTLPESDLIKREAIAQILKNRFTEHHSTPNPGAIDCAEFLTIKSPVKKPSKMFWSNSGTEATAAARKLCEAYRHHNGEKEKRNKTIYFVNGFAGRTHDSLAGTTSNPEAQRDPFWNEWDKQHSIYLPYPQKGKNNMEFRLCLLYGKDYFGNRFSLEEVDHLLIELPCQGEGGVIPVDKECLRFLCERMREAGVFVIADCVQCGMGRSGTLFGCDRFSWFEPDILTMGKALGGGFAIGATIFRADLDWRPKEHSNTFGGHPVTMAAALAALEETERLINDGSIKRLEKNLETRLRNLVGFFPDFILEIRGMGAMWALEIITENARDRLIRIGEELVNENSCGLLLLGAGNAHNPNNAIRVMPPLTITDEELCYAFSLLVTAFHMLRQETEDALNHHFIR